MPAKNSVFVRLENSHSGKARALVRWPGCGVANSHVAVARERFNTHNPRKEFTPPVATDPTPAKDMNNCRKLRCAKRGREAFRGARH